MKLTALEVPASFDRVTENLALADELLARGPSDLALLPEACLTGYVSPAGDFDLTRFAERHDGPTSSALAALAKKHATHLVGPLIERAGAHVYNAMIGFDPEGREFLHYRKRHPWYPEGWATPGDLPYPVVSVAGFTVTIAICFDIHFLTDLPRADVLLFPSAWVEDGPDSRDTILPTLGMHIVNANWGLGTPRLPGQGQSRILSASGEPLVSASSSSTARIDATLAAHC